MDVNEFITQAFSFSKMQSARKCMRKFFYRYVMRKKERAPFQLVGRAVHIGQEHDNNAKVEGRVLALTEVLDAAVEGLRRESAREGMAIAIDPFVTEHKRQLEIFQQSGMRDRVRPVPGTIEAPFRIKVDVEDAEGVKVPTVLEGFVDVVSENPASATREVIDYKTASKPMTQYDADSSLQFALYAMSANVQHARAITFIKGGKQKPNCKSTKPILVTEARREKLLRWIADSVRMIRHGLKTGDFPKCSPECYWCSATACDHYRDCYPTADPELKKSISVVQIEPVGTVEKPDWRK